MAKFQNKNHKIALICNSKGKNELKWCCIIDPLHVLCTLAAVTYSRSKMNEHSMSTPMF